MENQQGPTVYHKEFCSMFCGSLGGRELGYMYVYTQRMDTCICMAESLCFSPETITTLLMC